MTSARAKTASKTRLDARVLNDDAVGGRRRATASIIGGPGHTIGCFGKAKDIKDRCRGRGAAYLKCSVVRRMIVEKTRGANRRPCRVAHALLHLAGDLVDREARNELTFLATPSGCRTFLSTCRRVFKAAVAEFRLLIICRANLGAPRAS
jgi:hypothetical protein